MRNSSSCRNSLVCGALIFLIGACSRDAFQLRTSYQAIAVNNLRRKTHPHASERPSSIIGNSYRRGLQHIKTAVEHIDDVAAESPPTATAGSLNTQIKRIALPAFAACVIEPALTLIDMWFVGNMLGSTEATLGLAAMSVNGAVFNIITAVFSPLCTGTTAVVSKSQGMVDMKVAEVENAAAVVAETETTTEETEAAAKLIAEAVGGNTTDFSFSSTELLSTSTLEIAKQAAKVSSFQSLGGDMLNGVALSTVVGIFATVFLFYSGNTVLSKGFGISGTTLELSKTYLKIRGASVPFTLINYVLTGFSVGVQDMTTPLLSIVISAVVNIIGDYILVCMCGMGLAGAAWATSAATIAGTSYALYNLWVKYVGYDTKVSFKKNASIWKSMVNFARMKEFFSTSVTLMIGYIINSMTYSSGVRVAAAVKLPINALNQGAQTASAAAVAAATAAGETLVTTHIAAYQIAMQTWWSLGYLSYPLSLAAQAILPRELAAGNVRRAEQAIGLITKYSLLMSLGTALLDVSMMKFFPNTFTSNATIQRLFQSVMLQAGLTEFLVCMTTVIDGFFIGTNRLFEYTLAGAFSTSAALAYFYYSMKNGLGITGAWNGLLVFCGVRMAYFLLRFGSWKNRKEYKEMFRKVEAEERASAAVVFVADNNSAQWGPAAGGGSIA